MAMIRCGYEPDAEEIEALRTFAAGEGRTWKSKLRQMWMNAYYPGYDEISGHLQMLRNSEFDLAAFRFPS